MLDVVKKLFGYAAGMALLLVTLAENVSAAHIGDVKITRIRNFTPNYVVVWLDRAITNPPGCATVFSKIVVNGMETEWGKQRLSMLMTAMAAGYKVNPNCSNYCQSNWDGQLTICSEVSISK